MVLRLRIRLRIGNSCVKRTSVLYCYSIAMQVIADDYFCKLAAIIHQSNTSLLFLADRTAARFMIGYCYHNVVRPSVYRTVRPAVTLCTVFKRYILRRFITSLVTAAVRDERHRSAYFFLVKVPAHHSAPASAALAEGEGSRADCI